MFIKQNLFRIKKIKKKIDDFIIKKTLLSFYLLFLLSLVLLLPSLILNNSTLDYLGGIGGLLIYGIAWIPVPQYFSFVLSKYKNRNTLLWTISSVFLGWLIIFLLNKTKSLSPTSEVSSSE